ncbi:MAG TPA: hypothetical protein VH482_29360 [Thermomicrobiales bacterium]|jgi:hypothetical protein
MHPQSITWAGVNATAEDVKRRISHARPAETATSDRPCGELALAGLAIIKTLLVLIALAAAVTAVGHSPLS